MAETFYIDIDEEISSIIEKLRRSKSAEVYFVVPKRALFAQSIVNMKLLKKEAEKLSKMPVIVSQDEFGRAIAEKAGLTVKASIGTEVALEEEEHFEEDEDVAEIQEQAEQFTKNLNEQPIVEEQFQEIGSDGYHDFEEKSAAVAEKGRIKQDTQDVRIISRLDPNQKTPEKKPLRNGSAFVTLNRQEQTPVKQVFEHKPRPTWQEQELNKSRQAILGAATGSEFVTEQRKERVLEKIYQPNRQIASVDEKQKEQQFAKKGRGTKAVGIFAVLVLTLCSLAVAYLVVPSAQIKIQLSDLNPEVNFEVTAEESSGTEEGNNRIPVRWIELETGVNDSLSVIGKTVTGGLATKARGMVSIYNNYSGESQTLIATTRLKSAEGKIYRLVKTVVVPGQVKNGNEIEPGVIEVEAIADEAGADYNLEQAEFTIPGFEGSPKYEKFSAKISKTISGGKNLSEVAGDTEKKPATLEAQALEDGLAEIKKSLGGEEVLLDQAVRVFVPEAIKIGSKTATSNYKVQALIFKQQALQRAALVNLQKKDARVKPDSLLKIEYLEVNPSFELKKLKLRVLAGTKLNASVDKEKFKRALLGKDEQQLRQLIKEYPEIESVDIEISPSFFGQIPSWEKRVKLEFGGE